MESITRHVIHFVFWSACCTSLWASTTVATTLPVAAPPQPFDRTQGVQQPGDPMRIPADLLISDGRVVRQGGYIAMPRGGSIQLSLDSQGVIHTAANQSQVWQLAEGGGLVVNEQGRVLLTVQGRELLKDFCCVNMGHLRPANVVSVRNGVFVLSYDPIVAAQQSLQGERTSSWAGGRSLAPR